MKQGGEMSRRLVRMVALVLLGVFLATLPGLAGCAEEEGEVREIVIGYEGDWTGPAASGAAEYGAAFLDYFRMVEEENPIPGVKLKVVTYDTRSDYSRIPIGYVWLKGQGMDVFYAPSPADLEINAARLADDEIPGFGTTSLESVRNHEWCFWVFDTFEAQTEAVLKWILDDWEGEGKPKIGLAGWIGLSTTVGPERGLDVYLAANPDDFEYVGAQKAPLGSVVWAVEVDRLMDCDYIFQGCVGAGIPSFIKEARLRGYEGKIVACNAMSGFWNLTRMAAPPELLYDVYHIHSVPWTIDYPFASEVRELGLKYRPQDWVDSAMEQPSYATGAMCGLFIVEAIKSAVEEVGAANVDGTAIREAAESLELDLTAQGWGNVWRLSPDNHIISTTYKMFEWDVVQEKWLAVTDWFSL
jgi:hypothetical protein